MLIVPLQAVPNQTLQITLDQQSVQINVAQFDYGVFMTVTLDGTLVCSNVLCENLNPIVRAPYTGFIGDFAFFDTSGNGSDPIYTGLGDQFQLVYLEASDL